MKKVTYSLLTFILTSFLCHSLQAQNVVINEVLASNTASIQDEDSSRQDWIELYNAGATPVNLLGFGLSDDPVLLYKWTFPNVTLGAGQYLIVWASDKNRSVAGSPLHTNFKISASGEALYLTNTSATTISTVPAANLQADISYGKFPNGTGPYMFFGTPTPNAVNATTGFSEALNPPVFSQGSAFLTTGFNLTISSPDPGTTILYTLDGSEPDENNLSGTTYNYKNQYPKLPGQAFGSFLFNSFQTLQYTAPIAVADRTPQPNKVSAMSTTYDFTPPYFPNGPIYKGNVIRAKAVKPGALSSKVVTKNYFITPAGPSKFSLPVLSLSVDENELYDYEDGIAVAGIDFDNWRTANPTEIPDREHGNFERSGIANERRANMHYFVNGQEVINQDVGIRIRGAYSRVYPSKSWNIAARADFGDDNMSYKIFGDEPYTSYERLSAKSGGSDFYNTMFRDAMNHQLVKDLRMETESFQPMVVFMNGEYWGLLNMREKYDNNYFKQVYNIDDVDLLENQGAVQEGDAVDYNNMYNYIASNNFTSDANYTYIQTRMDTDNFIDYFTTNIFYQNDDWPGNNIIYWRKRTAGFVANAPYGHDGRWRWAIHDTDSTLEDPHYNSLNDATSTVDVGPNPAWSTLILRKLLANPTFKNDFINRFADLMNTNFLSTRIKAKIDEIAAIIAPEMNDQYFRWKAPQDNGDWQYHLNEEKYFADDRPSHQRSHIRSKFGISSNINATLNVSNYDHGYIKISTINIVDGTPGISGNPYPWTGVYFHNIPLKLKANAKPGYVFSHWTGASTSTDAEITITPTANFSITAVFIPDGVVDVSVPIYFWMMNGAIVNGAQLTALNSTYELATDGVIQYQSCNTGYPTTNGGKSSMERRNNPTPLNYRQNVNGNIPYATSDMRGLQIKQPFQSGGLENTMVFNFATTGYKKIKFSFAAVDEGAASAISIDYSVNAGAPIWITTGLTATSLPITASYQLFQVDFSTLTTVDNNSNFKIRLRFTGPNMTADLGNRVTFNNIAVDGVKIPLSYPSPKVYNVGVAIANLIPSTTQPMTSYSVSPSLPNGLTLNTTSGVISGTPTVASTATNYVVTGTYATGNVTFALNITVTDGAPTALSYASPNVFTKGTGISDLSPTSSGGAVVSYSIAPSLPTGLNFNSTTGIISGIPTAVTPIATYTVTATNSGGSTTFGIVITVKDVVPSALSYTSPNVFTKGTTITNLNPTVSGGAVTGYSITPSLPTGLLFDTATGVISGTPTAVSSNATYTVTATNSGGSTTFGVVIRVNDVAPSGLSYTSPNVFTKGTTITNLNPTISGGAVTSYSITPSLSSGLNFSTSTGRISGTPTAIRVMTTYTVTATNSGGSTTFDVVITVNDIAPSALSYTTPNVFTKGTTITNLNPTVSGGAVTGYSIAPNLPTGLNFNTTTGRISGTPTVITATATYSVTANNSGGSTSFDVVITVNDIVPSALSYTSPNVFTKGTTITNLNPTVSGGAVISYSIAPSLPLGLNFDTVTGVISGTPTAVSSNATYTVTATNSGGSTTFAVAIRVNDVAPNGLSYTTPNVFTRGTTITSLNPTVSGGTVISYSITPSLSTGLFFNTSIGRISGTPATIRALTTYTITATNSGGSTSIDVVITVNDIAPSNLSYTSPNVFTKGTTIANLNPTVSGGTVISYSIAPSLPSGLNFNTSTGRISGTPTVVSSTATYTVTANNSGGSTSFDVVITVNDIAPSALSYNSPNVFTKGTTITSLLPSISGTVISYSIAPSLPLGLNFNTATGEISGTPNVVSSTATYTVTANNSGGSTSFDVVITVNDIAPSALSYNSPNVFTKGTTIASLLPTISETVISYSITPSLPTGLNFDTATGEISGTPTLVSSTTTYTVTANNSGGLTSFDVSITVNDIAPSALSYNSPNVFIKGTTIASLLPTISGTVISYSIAPSLPLGLNFDTATGEISGTPTLVSSTTTYTVTANNSGGSTSFDVSITVNDIAPSVLSYNSPNVFTKGTTITSLLPTISGTVISYSITPSLPLGLNLNTTTGEISGTPTLVSSTTTYTVTANNSGGSTSFGVVITVNDVPPSGLSYTTPNIFTKGTEIASLFPTVSGGAVTNYSITPSLPTGLFFNTITGEISGTPTVVSAAAIYTVTATDSGGSATFDVVITVNDITPSALSYNSPNVFTKGTTIASLLPTISGTVISYSITPSLPLGLNLNTTTGEISGTPTLVSSTTTYTVTANNSGGSTSFGVVIAVNDVPPSGLSYTTPNIFTKGTEIASLFPTVSGGAVTNYSITPSLPTGLFFNTITGEISGTPTIVSSTTTYTVTANNSGGSTSFDVVITVNDMAPNTLSYNSPNVFTKGTTIVSLLPTISGNVSSYSITPSLPSGLNFDTATGEISGTPTIVSSTTTYTVTANNSGGATSFDVVITVNDMAPNALSYTSPNVFTIGTAITSLLPTISGTVISYSITPSLPFGLSFNTATGEISGTPTVVSSTTTYTVTANNSGGSTTFGVVITVNDIAPSGLSYPSPNVFTKGTEIISLYPTVSGGAVTNYNITPSLPTGLFFNTITGEIFGTPTVVSAAAIYTVTATDSGGSVTFDVLITVNDIAPSALSYNSPNMFTKGTTIASLLPTVSGNVISYSIAPSLPTGLNFNTATGEISGTPTVVSSTSTYTVTANNSGGATSFDVVITVNDMAPSALSYNSPNVFTKGTTIVSLLPTISGTVISYNITPSLPTGLNFNTATGEISGTPTVVSSTATYTVTATNSGGATSFDVLITVNDIAPSALSYTSPNVFTKGTTIVSLLPTISGTVISYSIAPSLPTGLNFNTATGEISGTPTVVSSTASYIVTANNSGGSTSFDVVITVNDTVPNMLSYTSPNVFTNGTTITSLLPTVSGTVISYSIAPSLPTGLNFNTATGEISGTPNVVSSTATYTVTANNSGGSISFDVIITVNDMAPNTLSYTSPNVFTKGTTITSLLPSVSGTVISYSITPSLPTGLLFNTATGEISGTPTVVSSTTTYTVTAINSGGSTSFDVSITVNDIAPSALSYNSPNVFTKGTTVVSLLPSVSGTVISYSIAPSLPLGLSFNTATGEISGTPTVVSSATAYTVTANNSGGSISFDVIITVNDMAPSALSYNSPNVFTKGTTIVSLLPTISGTVISYSITPSLPFGLSFNTATGEISGTPTVVSDNATYTVTANNSGGSASFNVEIAIDEILNTDQNNFKNLTVYPNPFDNVIHINSNLSNISYTVFSVDGKLIQKDTLQNNQIEFRDLPSGTYLLQLNTEMEIKTLKIIKR